MDEKTQAVSKIREEFAQDRRYIHYSVRSQYTPENTAKWLATLGEDGRFSDLSLTPFEPARYDGAMQKELAGVLMQAFKRIRLLAQLCLEEGPHQGDQALQRKLMLATCHYGEAELGRADGWFRFHVSCFGIPRVAYGIYFAFYDSFDAAEKADDRESLAGQTAAVLRGLMRQTFTQPKRDDVADPYTAEQFRAHVWWVGGNFAYRPLFAAAAVCSDVRMFDVIAEVASGSLSVVSANTVDEAFWSEGICADGAGWGHGRQCYVWGYPSHGVNASLSLLSRFKGTPWGRTVTLDQLMPVADYIEGIGWYQYGGRQTLMSPGRSGFAAGPGGGTGIMGGLADQLCQFDVLPEDVARHLQDLKQQREEGDVKLFGTRYFWNNDDLIYRSPEWTVGFNMISARSQSNEVVPGSFSAYTDFFGDGATYINRDGLAYAWAKGAWDCSAIPGTTLREQTLEPVKLWGGYVGAHNVAGGVGDGENGCAGFIYQKAENDGNRRPELYHVRACKAVFMIDGRMIALGAGIENLRPDLEGSIRTTLDQPEWRGPIRIRSARGEGTEAAPGTRVAKTLRPAEQGDIHIEQAEVMYTILAAQTAAPVRLVAESRPTHWVERHGGNKAREDLPATVPVMQVWIDHGRAPQADDRTDRYGYIVDATGGEDGTPRAVDVISNTPELQAVRTRDGRVICMIAYTPGSIYDDGSVRVQLDRPAVVMLTRREHAWAVTVADPLQDPERASVTMHITPSVKGEHAVASEGGARVSIPIPGKPYCGKSVTAVFTEP